MITDLARWGSCGSPGGGRREATPCPPTPSPGVALWPAIPEICPPGEGTFCLDRAAVADVTRLGGRRSGL